MALSEIVKWGGSVRKLSYPLSYILYPLSSTGVHFLRAEFYFSEVTPSPSNPLMHIFSHISPFSRSTPPTKIHHNDSFFFSVQISLVK